MLIISRNDYERLKFLFVISALSLTFSDAEGHGDNSIGAGDSIQTADEVRQVVQHTQVMLHHNDVPRTRALIKTDYYGGDKFRLCWNWSPEWWYLSRLNKE